MRWTALVVLCLCSHLSAQTPATTQPAESTPTTQPAALAELPGRIPSRPDMIGVSEDGKTIVYAVLPAKQTKDEARLIKLMLHRGGKTSDVVDLLPAKARERVPLWFSLSPDGRYLLVSLSLASPIVINPPMAHSFFVDLDKGSVTKLADDVVVGGWLGQKLVYGPVSATRGAGPLNVYDVAKDHTRPLGARGVFLAGLAASNQVLLAIHPDGPDKAMTDARQFKTLAHMAIVDLDGKLVRDVGPMSKLTSQPVVSPGGTFVAFQSAPADTSRSRLTKFEITVVPLVEKTAPRTIDAFALPVAVSRAGEVLGIVAMFGPTGAKLKRWPTEGEPEEISDRCITATTAGGWLYYVEYGTPNTLHRVRIEHPEPQAPADSEQPRASER